MILCQRKLYACRRGYIYGWLKASFFAFKFTFLFIKIISSAVETHSKLIDLGYALVKSQYSKRVLLEKAKIFG